MGVRAIVLRVLGMGALLREVGMIVIVVMIAVTMRVSVLRSVGVGVRVRVFVGLLVHKRRFKWFARRSRHFEIVVDENRVAGLSVVP